MGNSNLSVQCWRALLSQWKLLCHGTEVSESLWEAETSDTQVLPVSIFLLFGRLTLLSQNRNILHPVEVMKTLQMIYILSQDQTFKGQREQS